MTDTMINKVSSKTSPAAPDGEVSLASGTHVGMRMWRDERPHDKAAVRRDYETVGFVISGKAELTIGKQTIQLEPGDSWLVPSGAEHAYKILETFTAVEATSPPAHRRGKR